MTVPATDTTAVGTVAAMRRDAIGRWRIGNQLQQVALDRDQAFPSGIYT